jgi:pantoate--beta-alanine ligase
VTEFSIARRADDLARRVEAWRGQGRRIALVPTMGALHDGHLALIAAARGVADRVVASIFVNPSQFAPGEDFDRYPRQEAEDAALLEGAGCDLLFAPPVAEIYPAGFATTVTVAGLSDDLCGALRPGHFAGVATVVARLLLLCRPDVALFGEKDYQQLAVIRRMASDLAIGIDIRGVATVRDPDGLALSSRNRYLSPAERAVAPALHRVLTEVAEGLRAGGAAESLCRQAAAALLAAGFAAIDYVAVRDADNLAPAARLGDRPLRILAAARLGSARLIDNIQVDFNPGDTRPHT